MRTAVEEYIARSESWQAEMEELRAILLNCGLEEVWKWRAPCYSHKGNNIAIMGALKEHCVLSFFKGALLEDAAGILSKPGENSQSARVLRFTNCKEIRAIQPLLTAYIYEAIEVEKVGLKVDFKEKDALVFPEELLLAFQENPALKTAFEALTLGRQRGYNLYFSAAKQAKSRTARIEKYTQRILDGFGFHDCVCGLSKKMPSCDGSHKSIR